VLVLVVVLAEVVGVAEGVWVAQDRLALEGRVCAPSVATRSPTRLVRRATRWNAPSAVRA